MQKPDFSKLGKGYIEGKLLNVTFRDDNYALVEAELIVYSLGYKIIVRRNFITDFSSIPKSFSWFVDPRLLRISGTVHDWLFFTGELGWIISNLIWFDLSISGKVKIGKTRALVATIILFLSSWFPWLRWRGKFKWFKLGRDHYNKQTISI